MVGTPRRTTSQPGHHEGLRHRPAPLLPPNGRNPRRNGHPPNPRHQKPKTSPTTLRPSPTPPCRANPGQARRGPTVPDGRPSQGEAVPFLVDYRIRALLYAGKPNWELLAAITPPYIPMSRLTLNRDQSSSRMVPSPTPSLISAPTTLVTTSSIVSELSLRSSSLIDT